MALCTWPGVHNSTHLERLGGVHAHKLGVGLGAHHKHSMQTARGQGHVICVFCLPGNLQGSQSKIAIGLHQDSSSALRTVGRWRTTGQYGSACSSL